MNSYIFGVDLGGTSVKLGLFTAAGELLDKEEFPTRTECAGKAILPDIAAAMETGLARRGAGWSALHGVGLGVPGAVRKERLVEPCVNLNGWGGFDAAARLSSLCGCPVKVANDANAAALGELWRGSGRGCRSMVFVTLGTGVGGGIIVDGRPLSGAHGCAGELGHMKLAGGGLESCGCGGQSCLEQYASASGLVREARRLLAAGEESSALNACEELTAKEVLNCAKEGDALAALAAEHLADHLGRALAAASCVCDPEVFILGGGVSRAGAYLLELVQAAFVRYAFPPARGTPFALAALGNDAGFYGAAHLMLRP